MEREWRLKVRTYTPSNAKSQPWARRFRCLEGDDYAMDLQQRLDGDSDDDTIHAWREGGTFAHFALANPAGGGFTRDLDEIVEYRSLISSVGHEMRCRRRRRPLRMCPGYRKRMC